MLDHHSENSGHNMRFAGPLTGYVGLCWEERERIGSSQGVTKEDVSRSRGSSWVTRRFCCSKVYGIQTVDTLCNSSSTIPVGADAICRIKIESQPSPVTGILAAREWTIGGSSCWVHTPPYIYLTPLCRLCICNNGLVLPCHIDKYIAYCHWMNP